MPEEEYVHTKTIEPVTKPKKFQKELVIIPIIIIALVVIYFLYNNTSFFNLNSAQAGINQLTNNETTSNESAPTQNACTSKTCSNYPSQCDSLDTGCGGIINCNCPRDQWCQNNKCVVLQLGPQAC